MLNQIFVQFCKLRSLISTNVDIATVLDGMNIEQQIKRVVSRLSDKIGRPSYSVPMYRSSLVFGIAHKIDLGTLPYAKGASWNPLRVCLDNTRTALLEDIGKWIDSANFINSAQIFCLTGVAGAGKSAVAHTVAQCCHKRGLLASSFFLDRETAERNTTSKLFSTIARDLANISVEIAQRIGAAIEDDQSLATAAPSRHFNELILDPCRQHPIRRPVVVIIDALDEGYDIELLQILRDQVPKLPGTLRFLITSRAERAIVQYLSNKAHIQWRSINIHDQANRDDVALYARHKLDELGELTGMEKGWPGKQLSNEFRKRAEGLFIWVSTVYDYLFLSTDPTADLELLVSDSSPTGLPAQDKMDKLYMTILATCNWNDMAFVQGYYLLMGAIMAAKTPLSTSALQSLHRSNFTLPVIRVLQPVASLLTGLTEGAEPVRILHLSFRDFLTFRAQSLPDCRRFFLCEKEHSQRLAYRCLVILNQDLKPDIPGLGYLTGPDDYSNGTPEIIDSHISEELWYACSFWMDHLVEIGCPSEGILTVLGNFLAAQVVLWIEVIAAKGRFQRLQRVWKWLQVCD